ncbi:hypothetical protein [Lacticaseibacillus camelliae]|nr:hypothetical protein [Lacticaseibacillus camelliae]
MNEEYRSFKNSFETFLNSDERTAVIRGVNDSDKIIMVWLGLKAHSETMHGTVLVNGFARAKELLSEALETKISTKLYSWISLLCE